MIKKIIIIGGVFLGIGYMWVAHWRIMPEELIIITVPRTHSYLTTEDYKTFEIDFLTNDDSAIITMEEAYESLTLITGTTTTNLHLESVKQRGGTDIDDKKMVQYVISVTIPFFTEGAVLYDEAASLEVRLSNGQTMTLPIGNFAYHAKTNHKSHLTLNHLHNIASSEHGGPTAKGILFEVTNAYDHDVTITNVSILNDSVLIDQRLIVNTDVEFSLALDWNEIIDDSQVHEAIVTADESQQFAVRFENYASHLMYRYPIKIEYEVNNTEKQYLLEDFLFINTNPYVIDNQSLFKAVELND